MIIILMGVTGTGKSTVGKLLATRLGWDFRDADDYHPASNIAKMHRGVPLTDDDRGPWLEALGAMIDGAVVNGENVVLACSALKHTYQQKLVRHAPHLRYVLLTGTPDLIASRLKARTGHFMDPSLLQSQEEILEPPADALRVDVDAAPEAIVGSIRRGLGL